MGQMKTPSKDRRAWLIFSASCVMLLISMGLVAARTRSGFTADLLLELAFTSISFVLPIIGLLIAYHRPDNPIGWILSWLGFASGLSGISEEYVNFSTMSASLPATQWAAWLGSGSGIPLVGIGMALVFLLFPNGKLLSARWKPIAWLVVAVAGAYWIYRAFGVKLIWDEPEIENPLGSPPLIRLFSVLDSAIIASMGVLIILSMVSLVLRFRRSRGVERQQLKWFTWPVAMVAISFAITSLSVAISPENQGGLIGNASFFAAILGSLIGLPAAIAVAVLRYRLYDIDRVINRTLVYGLVTASLVLVYVMLVVSLENVVRSFAASDSSIVVAAATLAVAALARPLRDRVQDTVDRRFYRQKYDAARTLQLFSERLRDEINLDTLAEELRTIAQETMQPAHISVWLRQDSFAKQTDSRNDLVTRGR